jgi:hypothetical protein
MPKYMRIGFIICGVGIGVAVGGLAPVIDTPFVVVFAVGLGLIVGGLFATLRQIEAQINKVKRPAKET